MVSSVTSIKIDFSAVIVEKALVEDSEILTRYLSPVLNSTGSLPPVQSL